MNILSYFEKMKLKNLLSLVILISLGLAGEATAQSRPATIKLKDLQKMIATKADTVQVINFWATWCGPCVKELPIFEKLNQKKEGKIKVNLVSLDLDLDPNPEKVYKFVSRKNIQSRVLLLDERDPNSWIDKVDPRWSGALPATLIINTRTGKKSFYEGELSESRLNQMIAEIQ